MLNREYNNAREYDIKHNYNTKNLHQMLYDREEKNINKLFKGISNESKHILIGLQKIFEDSLKSDILTVTIPEEFRQIQELDSVVEIFCEMKKTFWTYSYANFHIEFTRISADD